MFFCDGYSVLVGVFVFVFDQNVVLDFVLPCVCICDSYSVLVRGGKFCPGTRKREDKGGIS